LGTGTSYVNRNDVSGLVVPPRDTAALVEAINRLLDDPALYARLAHGASARAALFDLVLARRVRLGNWNRFIDGDLAMLERSRSIFAADGDDDELRRRLDSLEIHPAGPMPGRETASGDDNERLRLEAEVLQPFDAMVKGLVRSGVEAQRRSLRLVPRGLAWDFDASGLVVKFRLRPGGFATTVLREVVRARVAPG